MKMVFVLLSLTLGVAGVVQTIDMMQRATAVLESVQ